MAGQPSGARKRRLSASLALYMHIYVYVYICIYVYMYIYIELNLSLFLSGGDQGVWRASQAARARKRRLSAPPAWLRCESLAPLLLPRHDLAIPPSHGSTGTIIMKRTSTSTITGSSSSSSSSSISSSSLG